jgi:D-tyrosyl-tRNA(Tyr) deacylase
MRVLVQRSLNSSVKVDDKIVGSIKKGIVAFVGFTEGDDEKDIDYLINKLLNLRIFDDEFGIMNKSILDVDGQILSISQFTLYADTKKGNRPSYQNSLNRDKAIILYELWNKKLKQYINVETGIFGADMLVNINNDGPITILLESRNKNDKR